MAITATWHSRIGEAPGDVSATPITNVVFGGSDDDAATAAADPIAQVANSIRRYFVVRFTETAGTASVIDNIVIDRSDPTVDSGSIDGQGTTMDAQAGLAYAENEDAALTSITELGASGSGTIALTNTGASLTSGGTASEDSQQFAIQIDTGAAAVAGSSALVLRCSFDIIA